MSVNIDPAGRRSVRVEVEVAGSPQDVWDAIATGPGVSSWFVPTEFEFGADGRPEKPRMPLRRGHGRQRRGERLGPAAPVHRESDDFAPGGPPVATEWTVEPLPEGRCLVSVEHSLLSDSDDWDEYLENTESGWPAFFTVLRIRMAHFRDEPFAILELMGKAISPTTAWTDLANSLNLADPCVGE